MLRGIPRVLRAATVAWRCAARRRALGVEAASYYSTAPLRETLGELIDFRVLCNEATTRLTVGAVNVRTGEMRYFDSRDEPLALEHVMASGALPPAFPAVRIDGEPYWDGGIYSNTPIEAVLDDKPRRDSLIFAVNVWHPDGPEPESIWQVMGAREGHPVREPRRQPHRAAEADPPPAPRHPRAHQAHSCRGKQDDASVKELASWGCGTTMHVARLLAPRSTARTTPRTSTSRPPASARAGRPGSPTRCA